jgi:hypothetical protein
MKFALAAFIPLVLVGIAEARTIVLNESDCEMIAVIQADAPRMSWAGTANTTAEYGVNAIDLYPGKTAFLIKYPLEKIPAGQKITRAEWLVPYQIVSPAVGARIQIRRILKTWGPGVSHENRMIRPQKVPWSVPGARGVGQDRAAEPTAVVSIKNSGEQSVNVTQDVELWYTGAAQNNGWMITLEDQDCWIRLGSPMWSNPKGYKLRITFEPE